MTKVYELFAFTNPAASSKRVSFGLYETRHAAINAWNDINKDNEYKENEYEIVEREVYRVC